MLDPYTEIEDDLRRYNEAIQGAMLCLHSIETELTDQYNTFWNTRIKAMAETALR